MFSAYFAMLISFGDLLAHILTVSFPWTTNFQGARWSFASYTLFLTIIFLFIIVMGRLYRRGR